MAPPSVTKPRARWCPYGIGYWTVRSLQHGTLVQGVGFSLKEAYREWHRMERAFLLSKLR